VLDLRCGLGVAQRLVAAGSRTRSRSSPPGERRFAAVSRKRSALKSALKPDRGFAEPPTTLPTLEECSFYHCTELPGLGVQLGQWDLRPGIDEYLGHFDFAGAKPRMVVAVLAALGFKSTTVTHHEQTLLKDVTFEPGSSPQPRTWGDGIQIPHYTVIGHR
jgi:hypothetical protein